MRCLLLLSIVFCCASCSTSAEGRRPPESAGAVAPTTSRFSEAAATDDWLGIYASPAEIGGYASTVLLLERVAQMPGYRMRSRSDVSMVNAIEQDERRGSFLTDGDQLYLPEASGFFSRGQPQLFATIERYTRLKVNGRQVLMRDDALQAYRERNELYDYGILLKVADEAALSTDLAKVEHPSIKLLYADPSKPWRDPFVHGPNPR